MPEHVGGDAHLGAAAEKPIDPRGARPTAWRLQDCDLARTQPIHLSGEREHPAAAERDDDRSHRERAQCARAHELERELAPRTTAPRPGERLLDERRVDRAQQQHVAVIAAEQHPRPGGAALRVVRPLHLVEHEHLALAWCHLDRAANDRCVLVHAPRPSPGRPVGPRARRSVCGAPPAPASERTGIDAAPVLGEEPQRVVRLSRVRRTEVSDNTLGLDTALGQRMSIPRSARRTAAR